MSKWTLREAKEGIRPPSWVHRVRESAAPRCASEDEYGDWRILISERFLTISELGILLKRHQAYEDGRGARSRLQLTGSFVKNEFLGLALRRETCRRGVCRVHASAQGHCREGERTEDDRTWE